MKASQFIQSQEVTLDFSAQFPGASPEEATLNLTVNPAVLTPAMEAEMTASSDIEKVTGFIEKLVVKWDLLDDAGVPIVLTADGLKDVPLMLLGLVVKGIAEAIGEATSAEGKL
jgi:hypothetical protein